MARLVLVIHNVRSALNVGSMLRTAEGLGVDEVYMTGYTPYPESDNDDRMPHLRRKTVLQIHKTALGAENHVKWRRVPDINDSLDKLAGEGYTPVALEQAPDAITLDEFTPTHDVALIVGNEVSGLEADVLSKIVTQVKIPMHGRKESFNVAIATGIALYHIKQIARSRQT